MNVENEKCEIVVDEKKKQPGNQRRCPSQPSPVSASDGAREYTSGI